MDVHEAVLLSTLEHDGGSISSTGTIAIPQPIFALSNRLIAYASAPPQPTAPTQSSSRTPRAASENIYDDNALKFPMTQADLGFAAMKIGGNLFSGMKPIGGRAYSAARAGVSAAMTNGEYQGSVPVSPIPGKFFSSSAPETSARGQERRHSMASASDAGSHPGVSAEDAQPVTSAIRPPLTDGP